MQKAISRLLGTLAGLTVAAALAVAPAAAQMDVAGAWTMEVTTDETGTTNPRLVLEQDGDAVTGRYTSDTVGEVAVIGTVDGDRLTISFTADPGVGLDVPFTYSGRVDADGVWSGNLDVAGGLAGGPFTATREGP